MAQDIITRGATSGNGQEVDVNKNALVVLPGYNALGVAFGGGDVAGLANFSEVDNGATTGARYVLSAEVDTDYRTRIAHDTPLDEHSFCADTAQHTTKFSHTFTTLTATQSTAGLLTNSAGITTTTTGMTYGTFGMFTCGGTNTFVCETVFSLSAQPTANTIIDFGAFQRGAATAYAPLDGVYFRLTSAGLFGVINNNGTETTSSVFTATGGLGLGTFTYANNTTYRALIQVTNVSTTFWINNVLYATIPTPVGLNFPCMSRALPWSMRHAIVGGAAGAALSMLIKDYRVFMRGPVTGDPLSVIQARQHGAYQGMTAATVGTLGTYTNSTNPAAAVPSNTSLAVGADGLLNQAWETFSLAVNTDGLLQSYQVPAGSATAPGRRLKVVGVKLSSYVQTVLAGGPMNRTFTLNFGHTAVSLATTESASFATGTTKARRVVLLPELTQTITAAQAVNTAISQPGGCFSMFPEPIYVNPGEFVAVAVKQVGTVGTTGTIVTHVQIVASFE